MVRRGGGAQEGRFGKDLSVQSKVTSLTIMKTAGVAELKARLSRYLSRVKAGEEILITERGVPVARLVAVDSAAGEDRSLRDLERQGLLRVGRGRLPPGFWNLPRGRDPRASVRKAAAEERDEGW